MADEHIRTDERGPIGIIMLARPAKKNAISIRMREEVIAALARMRESADITAIVVRGEGGCFSAGFDRDELLSTDADVRRRVYETSKVYHRAVIAFPKPLVAAVEGYALGGGFDLALLCDVRLGAEGAVFGHPEIKLGAPPLFTPLRLAVGESWARDLCLSGRRIDVHQAFRIGLVTYVVAPAEIGARAEAVAREIAEAPSVGLRATKSFFAASVGCTTEEWLVREHDRPFEVAYGLGR